MIRVNNLCKTFRLYQNPKDRLKELLFRRVYSREFAALDDVTFSVGEGETLGIVGENGAGKSTLLKILTGILLPTSGVVQVDGHITGLLELGTGFNSELTGLKNIYLNGLLIGMSKEEIDNKLAQIVAFTELGKFIEEPIKTYSSGMLMRLAFAVAIHADPQAFVVDEALSVGDAYFQQKCMKRIKDYREQGGAIIFVSHDLNAIKVLCDRALLLNQGTVIDEGNPEQIINTYNFMLAKKSKGEEITIGMKEQSSNSYGTYRVEITGVQFCNQHDLDSRVFISGEKVTIRMHLRANQRADSVVVGLLFRDRFGQDIFGTNSHHLNQVVTFEAGETALYCYSMPLNIGPGRYTLTVAVHKDENHISESYHWCDSMINFEVAGSKDYMFTGLAKLDAKLAITGKVQQNG